MTEYGVRRAIREDLPRLRELFAASLAGEGRRDPLLVPLGGDWAPFLRLLMRRREFLLVVLEVAGRVEGYCWASRQVVRGPAAPPSPFRRLLGRPRPRPLLLPFRLVSVEDIYLTREGRRGDGARALARAVREWAIQFRAARIMGSVSQGNRPAEAFARMLGFRVLRITFAVDLPVPDRVPPVPGRRPARKAPE